MVQHIRNNSDKVVLEKLLNYHFAKGQTTIKMAMQGKHKLPPSGVWEWDGTLAAGGHPCGMCSLIYKSWLCNCRPSFLTLSMSTASIYGT